MSPSQKFHVQLLGDERALLSQIIESEMMPEAVKKRASVMLNLDENKPPVRLTAELAELVGISRQTVSDLRRRYTARGLLDAIFDNHQGRDGLSGAALNKSNINHTLEKTSSRTRQ